MTQPQKNERRIMPDNEPISGYGILSVMAIDGASINVKSTSYGYVRCGFYFCLFIDNDIADVHRTYKNVHMQNTRASTNGHLQTCTRTFIDLYLQFYTFVIII